MCPAYFMLATGRTVISSSKLLFLGGKGRFDLQVFTRTFFKRSMQSILSTYLADISFGV
jgi:hypothetical protein